MSSGVQPPLKKIVSWRDLTFEAIRGEIVDIIVDEESATSEECSQRSLQAQL